MATSPLADFDSSSHPQGLFGKVHQVADFVTKAHGIYKAAQFARPYVEAGLRTAASFL